MVLKVYIYIKTSKGIVFDADVRLITKKYKTLLKEVDEVYRCIYHIQKLCLYGEN